MADLLASDDTWRDGTLIQATRFYADGTVTVEENGKVVESRRQTDEEAARFAPAPPSDADRVAALEAQNAALLAALSKATTLAQIRAAATDLA